MCTLTTMKLLITLHPLIPPSKIGNQKPIDGTLSHILCRMVQENPNAWRVIPITLPLARKRSVATALATVLTIKPELNGKESKSRKNE